MEIVQFVGKRALVTGGSRGIGKAIVEALYKADAKVFVIGKSEENLQALKSELPNIETIQVDLEDWYKTRSAVEKIGHVDLLVNNAGIHRSGGFLNTDRETFEKQINVNIKAVFNVSQVIINSMITRGTGGAIVNVSSIRSTKPSTTSLTYCISKAGLDMMTKVMALELGPHNIRVNSVNPTHVPTDMAHRFFSNPERIASAIVRYPLGKFVKADDVVNATLFLLSDKAAMITGTSLLVDGGFSLS